MENTEPKSQSLSLQVGETARWQGSFQCLARKVLWSQVGSRTGEVLGPAGQGPQQQMPREISVVWSSALVCGARLSQQWSGSCPSCTHESAALHPTYKRQPTSLCPFVYRHSPKNYFIWYLNWNLVFPRLHHVLGKLLGKAATFPYVISMGKEKDIGLYNPDSLWPLYTFVSLPWTSSLLFKK